MKNNETATQKIDLEGAQGTPDWSKAIAFAPHQPAVLPMVCQNVRTGQVLMVGYVSQESLAESQRCGQVVFWSRSRNALWKKGATSGHVFNIRRLLVDCDGDTLLALVDPAGPACHRQSSTCFDAHTAEGDFAEVDVGWSVIARVFESIADRAQGHDPESYTYKLLNAGVDRVLRKVGEECTETILAAKNSTITGHADDFNQESADLLFHWLVAVQAVGSTPAAVLDILRSRMGGPRRPVAQKV